AQEREQLLPVLASARAVKLPVEHELAEFNATLQNIVDSASDDCVRDLAGQGKSLKEGFARVRRIREALGQEHLALIERSRAALTSVWPALQSRGRNGALVSAADSLRDLITTSGFIDAFPKIGELTNQLDAAYDEEYRPLHEARRSAVEE